MIPESLVAWGSSGCSIREIAAYGEQRSAVVGRENVYNFTIGSPSIDPPPCVRQTIDRLMEKIPQKYGVQPRSLSGEAFGKLLAYNWPGNIRELENVIERMVILSDGPIIGKNCIPGEIAGSMMELDGSGLLSLEGERSLDAVCREYVHRMVGHCDGNIKKAAGLLGISRATVYKYLKSEGTP